VIAELLRCPACLAAPLAQAPAEWRCASCGSTYPDLGAVPFLFAEPSLALGEWRLRLQRLLAELRRDAAEQRDALARVTSAAARNRLKLKAAALDDHARRLGALLAPLGVDGPAPALETHRALGTPLPDAAGLTSYYVNAHRDWCWGAEENEAGFAAVTAASGGKRAAGAASAGTRAVGVDARVLVLGAGAGRLAYDLHQRLGPAVTIAFDVNPLFAQLARRLYAGERVELYEFPVAPRDTESQAILRTLAAESPARPGLAVVLGDALRAPFTPQAFDVVVTPWFIDVVDADFPTVAALVHELLRDGGRWVNTGSLAFAQADPARHYSLEEITQIVAASGFDAPEVTEARIPYLCSPASRHGRVETVVTFGATRRCASEQGHQSAGSAGTPAPAVPPAPQPDWLTRDDLPVPALPGFQSAALTMRIYGFVASLIDGRRSVAEIAQVLIAERLMTADGAPAAVRGFLRRLHEDATRRTRF
jgi:hypothetical protein